MNGSLVDYFPSGRGLRQGDPISPYPFLIVVEVFTQLLDSEIVERGFDYHPKCSELNLNHILFAVDLFVIMEPSNRSLQILKETLVEFSSLSGLTPNLSKSETYTAGLDDTRMQEVGGYLDMHIGSPPMKYLGVPLIISRLSSADCQPIMDKILGRIKSWAAKKLSYAGRLTLIRSILNGIFIYRESIFILPKQFVRKIECTLNAFLWFVVEIHHTKTKVSWQEVYQPKIACGLGLVDLKIWNKALILKHIWNIFSKKDDLRIKWIHSYLLKESSFWVIKAYPSDSWCWRKLLQLRDIAWKCIKFTIGNGNSIFV